MPHNSTTGADPLAADQALGLVTVACPKCGVTCGVLPGSDAWHGRCDGARMLPVDPTSAARLLANARQRRWRRQDPLRPSTFQAKNPASTGGLEGSGEAEGVGTPWRPSVVVR